MPMPPVPGIPQAPGPPAGAPSPATPGKPDMGGKDARGKIVAGLGLEMLRQAIPLLGMSEDGLLVTEVVAKLTKRFVKPPQDLGQAELKFAQSQIYGGGGQSMPMPQGGMPPIPPGPPQAQPLMAA